MINLDGFVKSKISPSRLGVTGDKGEGASDSARYLGASPSPHPSPVEREGFFDFSQDHQP
jgi:hypothetical protein